MSALTLQTEIVNGLTVDDLSKAGIIPAGTPAAQIAIFASACKEMGLSPVNKEIYLIAQPKDGRVDYFNIVAIAGCRRKAEESGVYMGKSEVMFDRRSDGSYKTLADYTDGKRPVSASIVIYKNVGGVRCEFPASIMWAEYVGNKFTHKAMPFTICSKVVEVHALRSAFGALSNVYIEDEIPAIMGETIQANNGRQIEIAPVPENLAELLATCKTKDETIALFRSLPKHAQQDDGIIADFKARNMAIISDAVDLFLGKNCDTKEELYAAFDALPDVVRNDPSIIEVLNERAQKFN